MSAGADVGAAARPRRRAHAAWRRASLRVGAVLVALVVGLALLSYVWTPHSPTELDIPHKLQAPSASHWLGTDSLGRDIVSLLIVGSRVSIAVGLIAVGIGIVFGVALGLLAAVKRGWVEEVVMRLADFTFAFPALLSAIMLTAIYGPGLVTSIVAIGIFNVPVFARITRASALVVRSREFVTAARALGKGEWRITIEHVLPNIAAILIVQATIQFALAILAEAALSYLGLGTQPPTPSWGRMLNEAQQQLFQAPQLAVYPGVAIALTVLGLNLLGDGLRDRFDPRLLVRRGASALSARTSGSRAARRSVALRAANPVPATGCSAQDDKVLSGRGAAAGRRQTGPWRSASLAARSASRSSGSSASTSPPTLVATGTPSRQTTRAPAIARDLRPADDGAEQVRRIARGEADERVVGRSAADLAHRARSLRAARTARRSARR